MKNVLFFLLVFVASTKVNAASEICAGTFQTFWQIEIGGTFKLKSFHRHPDDRYCERSMTTSPNAEVYILDKEKKLIRTFKTFLPVKTYIDLQKDGQFRGSIHQPSSQVIQIKFADDADFKKAKFVKIVFLDGGTYGPSSL